ncbi:MAG: hypothetical protein ABSG70_20955 [Terriglobales bacterium]
MKEILVATKAVVADLLEGQNCFARGCSENDPIGPVEVFDCATIGEKHGLADEQAAQAVCFDNFFENGGGSHAHGRDDRQNLKGSGSTRQAQNELFDSIGGIFCQEDHLGSARQVFRIRGIDQPTGTDVAADHFLQIFFVKGNVALGHFHDLRAISMAAADRSAEIGQAGGDDGGEVTGSVNANLHISLF